MAEKLQDGFRALLRRYEIEFEERYVWINSSGALSGRGICRWRETQGIGLAASALG